MSVRVKFAEHRRMVNFLYQFHHGYIILTVEGRPYLLDTGSPFSVGYDPICIGGRSFPVEQSYMGVTAGFLSEHIGVPIEGMIGVDVIREYNLGIYATEQMVQFSHQPLVGDIVLPLQDFMGVPIICVQIGGRVLRMFLDTGAPTSYLLPVHLAGLQPEGRHEDFYPLLGNFLTHVYGLDVSIGGVQRILKFGELPEELRPMLEAGNVDGLIGTELLRHFGLNLSLADRQLRLELPAEMIGVAV